jgi:hypothetical protein
MIAGMVADVEGRTPAIAIEVDALSGLSRVAIARFPESLDPSPARSTQDRSRIVDVPRLSGRRLGAD